MRDAGYRTAKEIAAWKQRDPIALLRDRLVLTHLELCTKIFEQGQPHRALKEMDKFEFLPVSRRLQPEIDKLRMLCLQEMGRRDSLRPVHAETMFQDSQRRIFGGDVETGMEGLRQVLEFYGDTPAAERARQFLRYIETRRQIRRLEGLGPDEAEAADVTEPSSALDREVSQLLKDLEIYQDPTATHKTRSED